MKNFFLAIFFLGHVSLSYGQDCDTRLDYNKLLKKRQVTTLHVETSTLLGKIFIFGFAKIEDAQERYVLNTQSVFQGEPYESNELDSLVFLFKDGTRLRLMHGYAHNPEKRGILNAYFCQHTFPISAGALDALAGKPLRSLTLYITGTGGISFDHLSERKQRIYSKRMGIKTYEIRRLKKKLGGKIQRLAACILQAQVPTVEQTMPR